MAEIPAAPVTSPWNLRVEVREGRTLLEARNTREVHFTVQCDRLDVQSPRGSIQAQGEVELTGTGIEGKCERLTISWQNDTVVLEGNVRLKCRKEGGDAEMQADRLSLRLNSQGGKSPEVIHPPMTTVD